MLKEFEIKLSDNIHCLGPLGFRESLYLWQDAIAVLTDSGGLQEETTALGVPCLTLRENTERPVTIELGTNAGTNPATQSSLFGPHPGALPMVANKCSYQVIFLF